jgi:hypothetical protein
MKLFSLDETDYRLKTADWLQYVCWMPVVNEDVKKQNAVLSNHKQNPIDSLLLSAFEFVDVNEAGATNKILDDASTAHTRKVKNYFTDMSEITIKNVHPDALHSMRGILKFAVNGVKSQNHNDSQ